MISPGDALSDRLRKASGTTLAIWCGSVAFATYVCMYGYRKPFSAATFSDQAEAIPDLEFKTALILSQVAGYMLSKFAGIRIISALGSNDRIYLLLLLITCAWMALLLLPLLPTPWNLIALFLNGLPLGMVWGIVFSYLEGRKITEIAGAMLCGSFILGSSATQSVGRWLVVDWHVDELWMPFIAGAVFMPPLLLFSWLLSRTPPPDVQDILERSARQPMNGAQRVAYFRRFATGLCLLVLAYMLLTMLREVTGNFAVELWIELGFGQTPSIFALTAVPITLLVLASVALIAFVRGNRNAVAANHLLIAGGFLLTLLSTLGFQTGLFSGVVWMVLLSTGLYAAYIPFNCILFDRLVAATGGIANAGFLIYVADSFGYLAGAMVLLYRNFGDHAISWVEFTSQGAVWAGVSGMVLTLLSWMYFGKQLNVPEAVKPLPAAPEGVVVA
jgi:MFS family permease